MKKLECTAERFVKDANCHIMTILRDDGVNRHIRFKRQDSSSYWFDLITWNGSLCIDGDCGTYVFRRLDDMFEFFRADRNYRKDVADLAINPSYWGEKLTSIGKHEKFTEFDSDAFDQIIKQYVIEWIKDRRDTTTHEERRDLWNSIQQDVIDTNESRKQGNAYDFSHRLNNQENFYFQDLFEYDFERYTFHFLWNCYAIAWGILQYDNHKKATQ
jgi:hypothetical protein